VGSPVVVSAVVVGSPVVVSAVVVGSPVVVSTVVVGSPVVVSTVVVGSPVVVSTVVVGSPVVVSAVVVGSPVVVSTVVVGSPVVVTTVVVGARVVVVGSAVVVASLTQVNEALSVQSPVSSQVAVTAPEEDVNPASQPKVAMSPALPAEREDVPCSGRVGGAVHSVPRKSQRHARCIRRVLTVCGVYDEDNMHAQGKRDETQAARHRESARISVRVCVRVRRACWFLQQKKEKTSFSAPFFPSCSSTNKRKAWCGAACYHWSRPSWVPSTVEARGINEHERMRTTTAHTLAELEPLVKATAQPNQHCLLESA
jgi:hypothetical protein